MTDTDKPEFAAAFNRLAVATRLPTGEADTAMKLIYWNGLADLELASVLAASDTLSRSSQWFPKVAEWRDASRMAGIAQIKALPDGRETPWEDECGACNDTGWEQRTCHPGTRVTCGRKRCEEELPAHGYVERCTCRPTNRTWARHHQMPVGQEVYQS